MHEYLATAPVIRTTSLEEARDAVARVYLPHRLEGRQDTLDMRLNAVSDRTLTVGFLTYQAETELFMPPAQTAYHVNLTVVGSTRAHRSDGGEAATSAGRSGTILLPDEETTVRWADDAEQLILKVTRAGLESHLADLLGRSVADVVDFDLTSVTLSRFRGEHGADLRRCRSVTVVSGTNDGPMLPPHTRDRSAETSRTAVGTTSMPLSANGFSLRVIRAGSRAVEEQRVGLTLCLLDQRSVDLGLRASVSRIGVDLRRCALRRGPGRVTEALSQLTEVRRRPRSAGPTTPSN